MTRDPHLHPAAPGDDVRSLVTEIAARATVAVGPPAAMDDIGNWTEPLGLAALFVDAVTIAVSLGALLPGRRTISAWPAC